MPEEQPKFNKAKRWALVCALTFFAIELILPAAAMPKKAEALFGIGDVSFTTVVADIPQKIWNAVSKALKTAADVAFKNMLKNYLNNLAYNYAVKLATGAPGQKPLFETQPLDLLKQAGDAAAGDFLDSVAKEWVGKSTCEGYSAEKCGTDSDCQPPVLNCPANIQITLPSNQQGPPVLLSLQPDFCTKSLENYSSCKSAGCTVVQAEKFSDASAFGTIGETDPRDNSFYTRGPGQCVSSFSLCQPTDITTKIKLQTWAQEYVFGAPAEITSKCPLSSIIDNVEATRSQKLIELSKSFNPEATELGMFLQIINETAKASAEAKEAQTLTKQMQGEGKCVETTVTGECKTPATFVTEAQKSILDQSLAETAKQTGSMIADAIGTFTNTLGSKLLDRIFNQGWNPFASQKGTTSTGLGSSLSGLFGGSSPGVTAAKILFANLQQTNYSVGGEVDILSKLASCPDKTNPTPDTCAIDTRFRSAIDQRLTVRQAIDQGLLDGTKVFGYDQNGREPEYYNGYPYRSLVILRSYRIIPVGWELAAEYIKGYGSSGATLNSIIAGYDNQNSPFYRLIDPNWVLKSPELFCKRQGAGEKVESETQIRNEDTNGDDKVDTNDVAATVVQRQSDYCADQQMCLLENSDGSCKKYGYCVEEKPVWKFSGTACQAEYNSCQSLTGADGNQVAYLKNTIDSGNCNAGNAGCQWYCRDWNALTKAWSCNNAATAGKTISLNQNATTCQSSAEGCNEFMSVQGAGVNLLLNSGFETFSTTADASKNTDGLKDTDPPDDFNNWIQQNGLCGDRLLAVSASYDGMTAAKIRSYAAGCGGLFDGHVIYSNLINAGYLTDKRSFDISFYAKWASDDTDCSESAPGQVIVKLFRQVNMATRDYTPDAQITVAKDWTRYRVSAAFGAAPASWLGDLYKKMYLIFQRQSGDNCDIVIDNVQLEEGGLSSYKTYENSTKSYLKKAPDYYNCYDGIASNDDPACANYALSCTGDEVGCETYTSQSTGRVINGVITDPAVCNAADPSSCDQCPAEFAGCRAYRELSIDHAPRRSARDPVSFVASTGDSCPATAVGCEEYTNLEEVAKGGEGKEYYSAIKQCVNTDDASLNTYYTWEGSDEFGYQLKKYSLKRSNADAGPCTNMAPEDNRLPAVDRWPNCVDNVNFDENLDGAPEAHPAATCLQAEVGVNPDCTEFFDGAGNTYYRLKSRIVYASAECKSYRNTIDGPNAIYHLIKGQGLTCSASYAGCRAYKGNASNNIRNIYSEDFEQGTVSPWIGNALYSNEAANYGGHSMAVANSAGLANAGSTLGFKAEQSYSVSFWAKAAVADTVVSFAFNTAPALSFPGQAVARTGEWNRYELGPLYVPSGTDLSAVQLMVYSNNAFYIDNIAITGITENIYLIKDSYKECSGYENCDAYTDRSSNVNYLKSFSSLCSANKVGCEAMIDTKNSASPAAASYQLSATPPPPVSDSVPADSVMTLVNDPKKSCTAADKGCQRLGKPALAADGTVASFADVYLRNNPDNYSSILCLFEDSGCQSYKASSGASLYFKDPGDRTCEYKQLTGQSQAGWYKAGTTSGPPDCPIATGICIGGADANAVCNDNTDCDSGTCGARDGLVRRPVDGWVGICTAAASGCTEYRDPEEPANSEDPSNVIACNMSLPDGAGDSATNFSCNSYYYISDTTDQKSCEGLVNRDEGCRLFNDTAKTDLSYDDSASQNGQVPATCVVSSDCDTNTIIKVTKDRECAKWLECATAQLKKDKNGNTEELCTARYLCDQMDKQTGQCLHQATADAVNQTYNTPAFVEKIKNYTGLVMAGLEWGRRCAGGSDKGKPCTIDTDCPGSTCPVTPQIIEGGYPYAAMSEVGSVSIVGDLIKDGDFGDSSYTLNQKLSAKLSEMTTTTPASPIGTKELGISELSNNWRSVGSANLTWTEENSNNSVIPSVNYNLDENNVIKVVPSGINSGAYYNLSSSIFRGEEYTLSFRMRTYSPLTSSDQFRVQFDLLNSSGAHVEYQNFIDNFQPTNEWQDYTFGPIKAGYRSDGTAIGYSNAHLNIIYTGTGSGLEFYLDNTSLKPLLKVQDPATTVARSCRLYPKDDAPYCQYTDDSSTTYKGWYGYCVERDPDYPQYCISWWPVDLLSGESDVFTTLRSAGYSGRTPLYMCASSYGGYTPSIAAQTRYSGSTEPAATSTGSQYSLQIDTNIDVVSIYGAEQTHNYLARSGGDDSCQPNGGWRGTPLGSDCDWSVGDAIVTNVQSVISPALGFTEDDIDNVSIQWINGGYGWGHFTGSLTPAAVKGGLTCNGTSTPFTCGSAAAPSYIDRVINATTGNIIWRLYPTVTCHGALSYQCLWLQLEFDGTTKQLIAIRTIGEDATGDIDEVGEFSLTFHLREACTNIVKVAEGSGDVPKAWSSKLESQASYTVANLLYKYNQNYAPYGGIVNPSSSEPSSWPLVFVEQRENPPSGSYAQAGSSYACDDDCQSRVCNWNANNHCINVNEIKTCLAHTVGSVDQNDGFCIGLGTGFCSNDVNIRCSLNADCGVGNTCTIAGGGTWASNKSYNQGIELLKRLFVLPYAGWVWHNGAYDSTSIASWQSDYQSMAVCAGNVRPTWDSYCGVLPTINNIVISSGSQTRSTPGVFDMGINGGTAKLSFNIQADKDQVPIRSISVDWGDGTTPVVIVGNYDSGTVSFNHDYFTSTDSIGIRIKVVDNWDWCGIVGVSTAGDHRYNTWDAGGDCDWANTDITVSAGV